MDEDNTSFMQRKNVSVHAYKISQKLLRSLSLLESSFASRMNKVESCRRAGRVLCEGEQDGLFSEADAVSPLSFFDDSAAAA